MRTTAMKILLASLILTIVLPMTAVDAVEEARLDAGIRESTSTLQFITALSGEQLAALLGGQTVEFSALDTTGQAQVLDAIELQIGAKGFRETAGNLPLGSKLILLLKCEFGLVIQDPAFGERGEVRILLSDLRNAPPPGGSTTLPNTVENPPSLDSVLSSAPEDKAAKAACLKQRVVQLLEPAGDFCLRQWGIPFTLSDFAEARTFAMASFPPSQAGWVEALYKQYDLYVQIQRDALKELGELDGKTTARASATGPDGKHTCLPASIAVGHITADNTKYPLPEWSALSGATVRLQVSYTPMIEIVGSTTCPIRRFGWMVNTL